MKMQQRVLYLEGEMVVHVPVQHCHCTCLPFMHMNDIWLTSSNLQQSSPNKPIPNCKLLEAIFVDKKKSICASFLFHSTKEYQPEDFLP
jgi:hypothetical protein